jgi:hypothetical protein
MVWVAPVAVMALVALLSGRLAQQPQQAPPTISAPTMARDATSARSMILTVAAEPHDAEPSPTRSEFTR